MNTKKLIYFLVALVWIVLAGGCSEEEYIETDYTPIGVGFRIVSPDGADLIAKDGELYGADFSVIYDGEIYKADWNYYRSRIYVPVLEGLTYSDYANMKYGFPMLYFGDFDGYHCDEYIVFRMPNYENHNIHIVRTRKNDKLRQTVTLDGEIVPEMSDGRCNINFTFVYNAD